MSLKWKIVIFTGALLATTVIVVSTISVYSIYNKGQKDIEGFREEEISKAREGLRDIVDIAYGIVEKGYNDSNGGGMKGTLELLSQLRFDNREGYFWITDDQLPYPTMIMHAAKPQNAGKVMSDPKYNVVKAKEGKNLYQERVEKVKENEDGAFVEYIMEKPEQNKVYDKLSYSRLFRPLGWVISTGIYTDSIEQSVELKREAITAGIKTMSLIILLVSVVILGVGTYLAVYFSDRLLAVIQAVRARLRDLSLGKATDKIDRVRKDELGDMTDSLNDLVEGITHYSDFTREIGNDKLDADFAPLSEEDVMGGELLKMRDNLKKSREETEIRNWTTGGIAKFADILRSDSDMKALSEKIIVNYVKYLEANQGSVFLLFGEEGEEPYLELMATYAYDRQKFLQRRLDLNEGIVAQCVKEKQSIHLKEVPESFVNITSGLGTAPPNSILIVPLKYNEEIFGAIEIASFKSFSDHQIQFAEKICEDIASTVSTVQTNERTRVLLQESQEMAENMRAQEEELRQNQEELQATQEQMRRRQEELELENQQLKAKLAEPASASGE